jgi:hypothetical protein
MPSTDANGVPYRIVWPPDVLTPGRDAHEFITVAAAVHEAAHAVVGVEQGLEVTRIFVHTSEPDLAGMLGPDNGGGVLFTGPIGGDVGVLVAVAARPAVARYMRFAHVDPDDPLNRATVETSFGYDEADAARWLTQATRDIDWFRAEAERIVNERWDRIMTLAQALADARGRLNGEDPALLAALTW